ncbi:hypothetical protein VTN96DRAFT_9656 [Rasamsonia emersonii]
MAFLVSDYFSWRYLPIALPLLFIGSLYVQRWLSRRSALAIGAMAPDVDIRGPLGLGFFLEAIRTWRNNTALEFWQWIFDHTGCAARGSYTAEVMIMNGQRMILTADPENVKAVLTSQFKSWGKGQMLYDAFRPFLGDSILSTDGEQWHRARQIIRPFFEKTRVSDLDLYERNVQRLIPKLDKTAIVSIDDLIFRYTLDTISEFLLGNRVGSLEDSSNGFTEAFNEVQRVQSVLMRAGPLTWAIPRKSYLENIKRLDRYMEPFISQALTLPPGSPEAKSDTLLQALASWTRDRQMIRDELTSVLFAGSDTTASSMSWIFFELARHPNVVAKLRALILRKIGTRRPTYQEIKDLKYLQYVINETQRLYATMPFATRQALQDTTLPRGGGPDGLSPIGVRAGTPIIYSALLMHRRRDLYPPVSESFPDPLEWVPERWEHWTPKSWQLIPFSGGPRICIGQQFALMEMGYTLCRILQTFEHIVDYTGGGPPVLKCGIVVTPFHGVQIGFVRPAVAANTPQE